MFFNDIREIKILVKIYSITFIASHAGPIENMIDNAQDITRSLTCAAELVANHTATKWKFRLQPVGNVLKDMQVVAT